MRADLKIIPDTMDDMLSQRRDADNMADHAEEAGLGWHEEMQDRYAGRLSAHIGRRVSIDCDDAPVTVAYDVEVSE